jgi:hypothetical protein
MLLLTQQQEAKCSSCIVHMLGYTSPLANAVGGISTSSTSIAGLLMMMVLVG